MFLEEAGLFTKFVDIFFFVGKGASSGTNKREYFRFCCIFRKMYVSVETKLFLPASFICYIFVEIE